MMLPAKAQIIRKSEFPKPLLKYFNVLDFTPQLSTKDGRGLVRETLMHRMLLVVTRMSDIINSEEKDTYTGRMLLSELLLDMQVMARDIMYLSNDGIQYESIDEKLKYEIETRGKYTDHGNILWVSEIPTDNNSDRASIK